MEFVVDLFLGVLSLYLALGVAFSVYFYLKAGVKLDEGVANTPWHFKLIIFPGVVLFWTVLLLKIFKKP